MCIYTCTSHLVEVTRDWIHMYWTLRLHVIVALLTSLLLPIWPLAVTYTDVRSMILPWTRCPLFHAPGHQLDMIRGCTHLFYYFYYPQEKESFRGRIVFSPLWILTKWCFYKTFLTGPVEMCCYELMLQMTEIDTKLGDCSFCTD